MLALPVGRIFLANQPTDLRKSFDGLAALVESEFSMQPNSGDLFVFLNKRKNQVRMLFWDRDGFCILMKRLEVGTFQRIFGGSEEAKLEIDRGQLALLLEGIVAERLRPTKRYENLGRSTKTS